MTKISFVPFLLLAGCSVAAGVGAPAPVSKAPEVAAPAEAAAPPEDDAPFPGGWFGRDDGPCTAARDHCLREGVWFVASTYDEAQLGQGYASTADPVFERDGAWWTWRERPQRKEGPAVRTIAAPGAAVAAGDMIIYYASPLQPAPRNDGDAHTNADWRLDYVAAIEGDEIVTISKRRVPLERARVVVERR